MNLLILFREWRITVSANDLHEAENLSKRVDVIGDLPDDYDSYMLHIRARGHEFDPVLLTPTDNGAGAVLTSDILAFGGDLYEAQLWGLKGDKTRATNTVSFRLADSITGDEAWPEIPSAFTQIENRIADMNSHPPVPDAVAKKWKVWNPEDQEYELTDLDVPEAADGRGIASAQINAQGHLIITYTDGTVTDAGYVGGGGGGGDSVFKVELSYSGGVYSVDKTFAEISSAIASGQLVYMVQQSGSNLNYYQHVLTANNAAHDFEAVSVTGDSVGAITVRVNSGDTVSVIRSDLDIDDVPTEDSDKLVRSGGVYAGLDEMALALNAGLATKYTKPTGGIPASDLASAVQTSLGRADTALQTHQSLAAYRTAEAQDVIDAQKYEKPSGGIPLSDLDSGDIDDVPIEDSDKLVRSGGVYAGMDEVATGLTLAIAQKYTKPSGGIPAAHLDEDVQESLDKADSAVQPSAISDMATKTWVNGQGFGTYTKPSGGIPKTDLASAVQTSLGRADTALQTHQSLAAYRTAEAQNVIDAQKYEKPSGGIPASDLASGVIPAVGNATLTIRQGGVVKGTFSANASNNVEVNLEAGGGGGEGTEDHNALYNRDAADQHPMSSITGLSDALSGKQATVSDLATIRAGAALGSTAVQPSAISDMATKTWVNGRGFGTYTKPSGGIPKTDLASAVQTSLGRADTALQTHQSLAAYRTAEAQDVIDAQKYEKPSGGIPLSDLDSDDIDDVPIEDSDKLVRSGGVYAGMDEVATGLTLAIARKYTKPSGGIPASDLADGVIPSVGTGVLTVKQGGVTKGTFSANAATDVVINLDAGGGGGEATFIINGIYSGGALVGFDRTYAEITSAYNAGKVLIFYGSNDIYQLRDYTSQAATFISFDHEEMWMQMRSTILYSDGGVFQWTTDGELVEYENIVAWNAKQPSSITDSGGYFTTDTVEGALQEIGAELAGVNTLLGSGVIV